MAYAVGDVVTLKGQIFPQMTVNKAFSWQDGKSTEYECIWFDMQGQLHNKTVSGNVLKPYVDPCAKPSKASLQPTE